MDVSGIIDALVNAASTPKTQLQNRLSLTNSASTNVSDIASYLSKLKTTVDALATPEKAQSYTATSSNTAISASITTSTSAARYSINVADTAKEYRAYTSAQDSASSRLEQSGQISIQVGSGAAKLIDIVNSDSLDSIVTKINAAGIGVTASTLFDGTKYRMQLRGANTGDNNKVTVGDNTGLALGQGANLVQQAQDAHITIDASDNFAGIDVYSHSNVFTGAIPGVTLTVSDKTTTPANITISSDSSGIKTKVQSFVDAYNSVIKKIHATAGYGTLKASDELLAGNSALRSVTSQMSSTVRTSIDSGNSAYSTLYSLGISTTSDGTLSLDSTKLDKAVSSSPEAVTKIFAGTSSTSGVMDFMSNLVKSFTDSSKGILTNQSNTLKANATRLNDRIADATDRLSRYRTLLEKQFSNMDSIVSASNATSSYLSAI
jgi:flagellar hook-associated protein 2